MNEEFLTLYAALEESEAELFEAKEKIEVLESILDAVGIQVVSTDPLITIAEDTPLPEDLFVGVEPEWKVETVPFFERDET